ncbi:hypothetical protein COLO4_29574 [Corchorus olitorius]|uniref:LRAT domain-containing protein n=1 Tax=Corchorus olitorius TaxID=93759 RepID=A0A1R3HE25_9ROSI|nr:hypothetical protein COLO4_29574 [Corchorus olitorius]
MRAGIYVGNDTVIHFTRLPLKEDDGVVSSSLDSFLAGGNLYRCEYAVSPAFLVVKRGGTCTVAVSDPDDVVVHRAEYLLENGFGCYNLFKNNCENFAIYCKTGLVVVDRATVGQSGQKVSAMYAATWGTLLLGHSSASLYVVAQICEGAAIVAGGVAATAIGVLGAISIPVFGVGAYCVGRYLSDISKGNVEKVPVEDLKNWRQA